jgi:hypothetical protein
MGGVSIIGLKNKKSGLALKIYIKEAPKKKNKKNKTGSIL